MNKLDYGNTIDSYFSQQENGNNTNNQSFRGNKQVFVMKDIQKRGSHTSQRFVYSEVIKISFDEDNSVMESKVKLSGN